MEWRWLFNILLNDKRKTSEFNFQSFTNANTPSLSSRTTWPSQPSVLQWKYACLSQQDNIVKKKLKKCNENTLSQITHRCTIAMLPNTLKAYCMSGINSEQRMTIPLMVINVSTSESLMSRMLRWLRSSKLWTWTRKTGGSSVPMCRLANSHTSLSKMAMTSLANNVSCE